MVAIIMREVSSSSPIVTGSFSSIVVKQN